MEIELELGKIKLMHSTHHESSLGMTRDVAEYEFEISEDLTVRWMMTAISEVGLE